MKTRSRLHTVMVSLLLSALSLAAQADNIAKTNNIDTVLSTAFPAESSIAFVKHASVVQASSSAEQTEKYMVLDFKVDNEILNNEQLQASIHSICNTVLTDYTLIEQLSNSGYDMISVSFDALNQYDCL